MPANYVKGDSVEAVKDISRKEATIARGTHGTVERDSGSDLAQVAVAFDGDGDATFRVVPKSTVKKV